MPGGSRAANKELAAAALAAGRTNAQTATAAGVCEKTVVNWKREPGFRARVAELRGEMTARAISTVSAGLVEAAEVLVELLTNDDPKERRLAAVAMFQIAIQGGEVEEVKRQLRELEAELRGEPTEGAT